MDVLFVYQERQAFQGRSPSILYNPFPSRCFTVMALHFLLANLHEMADHNKTLSKILWREGLFGSCKKKKTRMQYTHTHTHTPQVLVNG